MLLSLQAIRKAEEEAIATQLAEEEAQRARQAAVRQAEEEAELARQTAVRLAEEEARLARQAEEAARAAQLAEEEARAARQAEEEAQSALRAREALLMAEAAHAAQVCTCSCCPVGSRTPKLLVKQLRMVKRQHCASGKTSAVRIL